MDDSKIGYANWQCRNQCRLANQQNASSIPAIRTIVSLRYKYGSRHQHDLRQTPRLHPSRVSSRPKRCAESVQLHRQDPAGTLPLHARYAHPKLGGGVRESTDAQNRGSIIHKLLLGKGSEIAIINHDDYRKTEAREARDAALNAGQIPSN